MSKVDLEKQIDELADGMFKSSLTESDAHAMIKELGVDGLKKAIPHLDDEEKTLLCKALDSLKKSGYSPEPLTNTVPGEGDYYENETKKDADYQDEVVAVDAESNHRAQGGNPILGWKGQEINDDEEPAEIYDVHEADTEEEVVKSSGGGSHSKKSHAPGSYPDKKLAEKNTQRAKEEAMKKTDPKAAAKKIKGPAKVNEVMDKVPEDKRDDVLRHLRNNKKSAMKKMMGKMVNKKMEKSMAVETLSEIFEVTQEKMSEIYEVFQKGYEYPIKTEEPVAPSKPEDDQVKAPNHVTETEGVKSKSKEEVMAGAGETTAGGTEKPKTLTKSKIELPGIEDVLEKSEKLFGPIEVGEEAVDRTEDKHDVYYKMLSCLRQLRQLKEDSYLVPYSDESEEYKAVKDVMEKRYAGIKKELNECATKYKTLKKSETSNESEALEKADTQEPEEKTHTEEYIKKSEFNPFSHRTRPTNAHFDVDEYLSFTELESMKKSASGETFWDDEKTESQDLKKSEAPKPVLYQTQELIEKSQDLAPHDLKNAEDMAKSKDPNYTMKSFGDADMNELFYPADMYVREEFEKAQKAKKAEEDTKKKPEA